MFLQWMTKVRARMTRDADTRFLYVVTASKPLQRVSVDLLKLLVEHKQSNIFTTASDDAKGRRFETSEEAVMMMVTVCTKIEAILDNASGVDIASGESIHLMAVYTILMSMRTDYYKRKLCRDRGAVAEAVRKGHDGRPSW